MNNKRVVSLAISREFATRFVNEPLVLFPRSWLHNPRTCLKILPRINHAIHKIYKKIRHCEANHRFAQSIHTYRHTERSEVSKQNKSARSATNQKFLLLFAFAKSRILSTSSLRGVANAEVIQKINIMEQNK